MHSATDSPFIAEPVPLDVREILDFLLRRWKFIFGIAAITFGAFLITAYTIPPSYMASAQILLDSPKDYITQQEPLNSEATESSTFVESQLAVLGSSSLLQKVVDGEKLAEDPDFGLGALEWLRGALEVSRLGLSDVIELSVTSYDPERAASLANALAQAYVVDRVESRYDGAKKASTWLSERAESLRIELSRSEVAVERFRSEHNLLGTRTGSLTEQQMS